MPTNSGVLSFQKTSCALVDLGVFEEEKACTTYFLLLNYHMEWKIIISWNNWHPVTGIVRKPMDDNQYLNTTNEEPSTPLLPFGGAPHTLA